ncbi:cytochrome b5 [Ramicandelaber brevisporus]|nr:cytochrome b5 [Ramicandelaber brevisporus]
MLVDQLLYNQLNWVLLAVALLILRSILFSSGPTAAAAAKAADSSQSNAPQHPRPLVFREFTPTELAHFNGRQATEDGSEPRIYIAVRRTVYDVTPGKSFYGPDGPYGNFSGRDASRGLAKNSFDMEMITPVDQPLDKLDNLDADDLESLDGWQKLFESKYTVVGKLVDPFEK